MRCLNYGHGQVLMKWSTKGISILKTIAWQLVIPAPKDDDISKIDAEQEYTVEIRKKSKKRSLNANAYCWVLCQKIAVELSKNGYTSKEDVYRKAIMESQQGEPVGIPNNLVDSIVRKWKHNGIGWMAEIDEHERLEGIKRVYLYAGSSTYNTAEMSRLIEALVDECRQLDIPIEPSDYVKSLIAEWGEQFEPKKEE